MRVGVRELKNSLSAYLDRVKAGESVVVTERGTPVARLVPPDLPEGLIQMIHEGALIWRGGKPPLPTHPLPYEPGSKLLSDIVIEDRGGSR